MVRKKIFKIGKDIIHKTAPSKAVLTIKLPPNFLELKLQWENKEKKKLSKEELEERLKEYYEKKKKKQRRKHKSTMPSQTKYI